MEKERLGLALFFFGIICTIFPSIVFYLDTFFYDTFNFSILIVLSVFVLPPVGIIFLTFGIKTYLKDDKKKIGLASFVTSVTTFCYLIIPLLFSLCYPAYDIYGIIYKMFYYTFTITIILGFFSIISGAIANWKTKKLNKFGIIGLILGIASLSLTYIIGLLVTWYIHPIY